MSGRDEFPLIPEPDIAVGMTVQRLLDAWPGTARVFIDRRMACVGCPVAAFETIEEVARIYETEADLLVQALRRCAARGEARGSRNPHWPEETDER